MKKTFLAKRNALLSSAGISGGVYALACAFAVLLLRLLAPNFFWHIATPIFKSADALTAKSHSFFNSFGDTAKLALKNEQLANENATLASENQALLQKVKDTSELPSGILAGVVARPPESPYDTLILAAGKNAGVAVGMEAFGAGGVPLGVVSSVLADFSRVTLFSSPGTTIAGWVGRANLPLTIFGAGAGAMNATAARSAGIVVGDIVSGPGPGMLPIGTVVRVDSDPSSPSVTLRIQPARNLFSLSWVLLRDIGMALLISATSSPL